MCFASILYCCTPSSSQHENQEDVTEADLNNRAAQKIQRTASRTVMTLMMIIALVTTFVFSIAYYGEICSFSYEQYELVVVTLHDIHFCERTTPNWAVECPSSLNKTYHFEEKYTCPDMMRQITVTSVFMFTTYYLYIFVVALYSFFVVFSLARSFLFGERFSSSSSCSGDGEGNYQEYNNHHLQQIKKKSSSSWCKSAMKKCCRSVNKFCGRITSFLTFVMSVVLCFVPLFSILMSIPAFLTISLSLSRLCREAKDGMFVRPLVHQPNFEYGIATKMVIVGATLCWVTTIISVFILVKARKKVVALTVTTNIGEEEEEEEEFEEEGDDDGKQTQEDEKEQNENAKMLGSQVVEMV